VGYNPSLLYRGLRPERRNSTQRRDASRLCFARQGIHIHRIDTENIDKSPQEIHHVKPHISTRQIELYPFEVNSFFEAQA
jgi:hypothetical protein